MALDEFKPNFYELIVLDIKMPQIDGFQLYDQLKSRDPKIKTIFFTALSDVESYSTENSKIYPIKGERHFFSKPVSNHELLEQVYTLTN